MKTTREILHSSASVEWYTPSKYAEAARRVMGSIDLDPASCAGANEYIKAEKYFTKSDNGLVKMWQGNIFLNPPYGRGGQAAWSKKMIHEYRSQNIKQGVMLLNAATSSLWFEPLWQYPICFVQRRIKFVSPTAEKHSPTHGNVFVYLGENKDKFIEEFKNFGPVVIDVARKEDEV